jgi:hypothetical protein
VSHGHALVAATAPPTMLVSTAGLRPHPDGLIWANAETKLSLNNEIFIAFFLS